MKQPEPVGAKAPYAEAGASITDPSLSDQPPVTAESPLFEQIGHYRIEGEIGRGGMGIVYRAQDTRLGRTVAIKSLPLAALGDPHRRARFEREAKLLALVNHPGIAAIHAVEEQAGWPFLILEHVPGESLAERLAQGPLALLTALEVGRAIAAALEAAHERGVVHRDLKPANVRITPQGEVKLLDFGLAKLLAGEELNDEASPLFLESRVAASGAEVEVVADADLSVTGALLGSAGYMSPEQARGERIDRRADVWAFGCVLFECLTGGKLWGQGSAVERLRAIASDEAPLGRLPDQTPAGLRRLLERCLEKERSRRLEGLGQARRELEACLAALRTGREAAPPASLASLPVSLTRFVGRTAEQQAVTALVERNRLVTLTGLGGVGKTRLALQVAEGLAARFPAGVAFVDLAPLVPGQPVAPAVASAVGGVREVPGLSLDSALSAALAEGERLLVLDNCEEVTEATRTLSAALLRSCPGLTVLATSRRPLVLPEEACFPVLPLVEAEALHLFVDRAQLVASGFALDEENRADVAEVVRRVAGIPLALELAAARLRVLSAAQLARRLDARLGALGRSTGPRRETLAEVMAWSYEGLGRTERLLLNRLAVFAGSFTLEAAEEVCTGGDLAETDVLDALSRLIDWVLVAVEKRGSEVRYRLLVPVHELARDRLRASGEEAAVCERHLDCLRALTERAARHVRGPDQAAWVERLELELDDVSAALRFAAGDSKARDRGLRMATVLQLFWRLSHHAEVGRSHIERLLEAGGAAADPALRERALNAAGELAYVRRDLAASRRLHEEALAAADAIGSRQGRSRSMQGLALAAWEDGNLAVARTCWLEQLAIARELGERHAQLSTLGNLGNVASRAGDETAARAYREESLTLARELGNVDNLAKALANLALIDLGRGGDHGRARALLEESIAVREKVNDRVGILACRSNLAMMAMNEDPARARTLYQEVLQAAREIDAHDVVCHALNSLCVIGRRLGNRAEARSAGCQGLVLARRIGYRVFAIHLLENLVWLDLDEGQLERAARLLGAADAVRMEHAIVRERDDQEEYEQGLARLRAGLGDQAYMAARSAGSAIGLLPALDQAMTAAGPCASGSGDAWRRTPTAHLS